MFTERNMNSQKVDNGKMQNDKDGKNKDVKTLAIIQERFKGKLIKIFNDKGLRENDRIKMIKAAYYRSMAITDTGKVYVWGCSFRNEGEVISIPSLLFHDKNGIEDVQLGRNHGAYIQSKTSRMFTWGDHSFGQTGNNYEDDCYNYVCLDQTYSDLLKYSLFYHS